jgi:hypothetical protein
MENTTGTRNHNIGVILFLFLAFPALAVWAPGANATSGIKSSFLTKYGITAGSKLDTCGTCHVGSDTSRWNPYGTALLANINSGLSNTAAMTAIEPLDSDGDGFTNLAEITARTFPGDAADKPAAGDTTPPVVNSTTPANSAMGVAVGTAVTATFSEAVAPASVTASSFTVSGVTGTISVNGAVVTFIPSAPLSNNTAYTATLTTSVTDVAGNHLAANRTWTFTTTATADTTAPRVSSVNPLDTQPSVQVNSVLTVTFSEAVVVPAGSITLSDGAGSVPGTVSVNGAIAAFDPSVILSDNTTYTVTVTTAVTDLTGNHLATPYSSTFTTSAAATAPVLPPESSGVGGGGCAMAGTKGDVKDIAGTYGILILAALGMAIRGRVKRKEK